MNNTVQYIEEQLGITLEKYDYKKEDQMHTYRVWQKDQTIRELVIQEIVIENIDVLFPLSEHLHTIKLINCTVHNIVAMYSFKGLCNLTLDNVTITDLHKLYPHTDHENFDGYLRQVNLLNMEIKHLSMFFPLAHQLDHVFITNCTLHNFYEVNLFPKLYDLRLTNVNIKQSKEDVIYKPKADRNFTWLWLNKMEFEDIDFFLPIAKDVHGITLNHCTIGSIRKLVEFTSLQEFEIDAFTKIKDIALVNDSIASFKIKECIISENDEENDSKEIEFNIEKLAALANHIESITFKNDCISNHEYLLNFKSLHALKFDRVSAKLKDFLTIATQIVSLDFSESTIINRSQIQHFKNLEVLKIDANTQKQSFKDFKTLLPLKNQLKKFDFWEFSDNRIKNLACIQQFTALESVFILHASKKVAQRVFSLPSLKKLSINIRAKKVQTFNVEALKNIEELYIENDNSVTLKGLKNLQNLEVLSLKDYCSAKGIHKIKKLRYLKINKAINISDLPAIDTLTKLEIDVTEDYEILSLEQFPNLRELSIKGTNKITLGHLPNLRVLDISSTFPKEIDFLDHLPNLEKLCLENNCMTAINGLDKLTNLKMLNLSENRIQNIDGLANLKSLERLNLYENEISEISILNTLPKLKEVNLAGNIIERPKVLKQLDKPETAIFYGLPEVPFWIWEDQDFEL
ncbi:leucine-rich repeat domain-containing protein [Aquimarina litoralis]|uniref:leucine-rich repeat domain-containing protein n=1 Tax=Aquimarina litoralis TaxID=584605 RepID=UPI001C568B3F|nr:leucine-rich repeat domain-containing protein [Aquimarina litoralis]MBW1294155.1 hypothetical protein [Aquimarina litoralis]